jgi:hypothetical protein
MFVTVLWEDQRATMSKGFGPHELLLSCLEDDSVGTREVLKNAVIPLPKKGNGNVLKELRSNGARLVGLGPLVAVFDRDQAHALWGKTPAVPDCMSGIKERLAKDAPGPYEVIFLIENTESLLHAVVEALRELSQASKPNPDQRDRLLGRAAWGSPEQRTEIRRLCPSFDRLVLRVAQVLRPCLS